MKVKIKNNIFSSDHGIFKIGDVIDANEDFIRIYKTDIEVLDDTKEVKKEKDKMMRKNKTKKE